MRYFRCAVFLLSAVTFYACAFSPVRRPEVKPHVSRAPEGMALDLSVGDAVEASKEALEAMGYEILTANPALGLVRTKVRSIPVPEKCDCGTWNASPVKGTAESTVIVNTQSEGEDKVSISISMECITNFTGQNLYGATTRRETYPCASRGIIEQEFWPTLQRILLAKTN